MKPAVSFGLITDCQFADADDEEFKIIGTEHWYYNYYRRSPDKLRGAVRYFNGQDLDFVVHLGDFIDRNLDDAEVLLDITKDLKVELWHALGNHDFTGSEGHVDRVLTKFGMPSAYYSKSLNGYRFVVIDTNEVGVIEHAPETDKWKEGRKLVDGLLSSGATQAYDWNGALSKKQLQWLNDEIAAAKTANEQVIIFAHHPVFPPSALNALNDNAVLDVIDAHDNVLAFINGHNHNGGFGTRGGVPYVTLQGILNGVTNAFGVASVYEDRIEIDGYGRIQKMVLERKKAV